MRIGIVGAGMIGSTLAKLWIDAGHDVRLASRHPEDLLTLVAGLGKRATAGTPAEAATFGDVVMLTVPLRAVPDLARELGLHWPARSCSTRETPTRSVMDRQRARPSSTPRGPPAGVPRCFREPDGSRRSTRCTSRLWRARRIEAETRSASRWPATTLKQWRRLPD
jgi:hypothetical protein